MHSQVFFEKLTICDEFNQLLDLGLIFYYGACDTTVYFLCPFVLFYSVCNDLFEHLSFKIALFLLIKQGYYLSFECHNFQQRICVTFVYSEA